MHAASLPYGRSSLILGLAFAMLLGALGTADAQMNSQAMENAVQARLRADPYINGRDIVSTVKQQQVTLRGFVPNLVVKTRAERIAETVPGVVEVHNEIRIKDGEQVDDDELQEAILKRFTRDPYLSRYGLDVDVAGGVATLRGRVPRRGYSDAALDLAAEVDGLTDVRDDIQVRADIETEEGLIEPGGGPVPQGVGVEGANEDAGGTAATLLKQPATAANRDGSTTPPRTQRSPSQTGSSRQLIERARQMLASDARFRADDFTLEPTPRGVVVRGTVRSMAERRALRQPLGRVDGLDEIDVSGVSIDPEAKRSAQRGERLSDAQIRDYIRMRLDSSAQLDGSTIEVDVADRSVTLTGTVPRRGEKRRAASEARMVRDVRSVQNEIEVSSSGSSPNSEDRAASIFRGTQNLGDDRAADDQTANDNRDKVGATVFQPDDEGSSTSRGATDDSLEAQIEEAVRSKLSGLSISVAGGVVNVQGEATSDREASAAIAMIESMPGVDSVLNNVDVMPSPAYAGDLYVDGVGTFDVLNDEGGPFAERGTPGLGLGSGPARSTLTDRELRRVLQADTPGGLGLAPKGSVKSAEQDAAVANTTEEGAATDGDNAIARRRAMQQARGRSGGGAPANAATRTEDAEGLTSSAASPEVLDDVGPIDQNDLDDTEVSARRGQQSRALSGSQLVAAVERALDNDPYIEPGQISVQSEKDNAVILAGAVTNYIEWARARRIAFNAGAVDVDMRVEVE